MTETKAMAVRKNTGLAGNEEVSMVGFTVE
jgi:hypothetical protein